MRFVRLLAILGAPSAGSGCLAEPGDPTGRRAFEEESCCEDDGPCQDGSWCNGRERCDCWGACEPGPPINCDDGDPCTRDRCDEGVPGDDAGRCIRERIAGPGCGCSIDAECDDGRACTRDVCDRTTGLCTRTSIPPGSPCDDGVSCTSGEICDAAGVCGGGVPNCPPDPLCPTSRCDTTLGRCAYDCGVVFDREEDWARGSSDGVTTNPAYPLHPDCTDPGTVCLGSSMTALGMIWVPNSDSATVAKMNVDTGAIEPGFPRPSLGTTPSRTVIDPRDGSAWLANRGLYDGAFDGRLSSIVHFASDGSVICRTPLPGIARALTIDVNHDVWVGLHFRSEIVKFSGTLTDPGSPYAVCRELERYPAHGRPYGAAADSRGNVWFLLHANWAPSFDPDIQSLLQVPVARPDLRRRLVPPPGRVGGCFNTYGIAVDATGRVWIAAQNCGSVIRYDPSDGTWRYILVGAFVGTPRGIAIGPDGQAYSAVSHHWRDGEVRRVVRVPLDLSRYDVIDLGPTALLPVGTAIDVRGRVWAVNRATNNACRVTVDAWPAYSVTCYPTGGLDAYAYTDMTGMQYLLSTSPTGTWTVDMDSGDAATVWNRISWTANEIPGVTDVSVRARAAATRAGLAAATWSPTSTTSPADIRAAVANPNRWLQVQAILTTTDPARTPVLYDLSVGYSR